mmetsp:Transcript_71614/g.117887  ORF Transcript_71614/g.117887 Transcript_71614/m.117887 type:complete len:114 (-) Transcript_71614:40-381(-)
MPASRTAAAARPLSKRCCTQRWKGAAIVGLRQPAACLNYLGYPALSVAKACALEVLGWSLAPVAPDLAARKAQPQLGPWKFQWKLLSSPLSLGKFLCSQPWAEQAEAEQAELQ